jgi:hypothetical protein
MVRVIRRSMRCLAFGLIGLVPLVGTGFACQALRLGRAISLDFEDGWRPPPVYGYWLVGTMALVVADAALGLLGDLAVCSLLLGLQSWHCWRRSGGQGGRVWNPGHRELRWGVIFARAGLGLSLWTIVVLVLRVSKALGV